MEYGWNFMYGTAFVIWLQLTAHPPTPTAR